MKASYKAALLTAGTALLFPGLLIKPTLAETPSLDNGIMCVARGKMADGTKIYFYTSMIDHASIQQKQPVSVMIQEPTVEITEAELVILDKKSQTLLVEDAASETTPEMTPVGKAQTVYQGNDTFSGETAAGSPLSFTLAKNYGRVNITHNGQIYKGVCH